MIAVPFDQISKETIERLVTDGAEEDRELEYKAELPGPTDDAKREFAADVSSFANARGGYIVFGVTEKRVDNKNTGQPEAAVGCSFNGNPVNVDEQLRRLDQMAMAKIDPRIHGIQTKALAGFGAGPVFVMRIPRTWNGPHMVTAKESPFHVRLARGKYQMDVTEIRKAFAGGAELANRIRAFRDERLGRILSDETPVPVDNGFRIVVHIVPFSAMSPDAAIDLQACAAERGHLAPMGARGWDGRFNVDGYFTFAGRAETPPHRAYTQVFRSGAMELVSAYDGRANVQRLFHPDWVETEVITALENYMRWMPERNIEPPVSVIVSLLNMRGATFARPRDMSISGADLPITRDVVLLPDALMDAVDGNAGRLLKGTMDAMWQMAGADKSPFYDDGDWRGPR